MLGLGNSANEGAQFFLACVDGLKGFPQALEAVYPQTTVQLCIVSLVRGSWPYGNWKERRPVAQDGRAI